MKTLEEANKKMHPAETGCWAHTILTEKGFVTDTLPQQGFVRSYSYEHSDGSSVLVFTGTSCDYWYGKDSNGESLNGYSIYPDGLTDYLNSRN